MTSNKRTHKNDPPLISIIAISYNHENYIRHALDSFLSQKTDFRYEIIIADDCSSDDTQKIIKEYATKYPGTIKPLFHKANIGVQKNFKEAMQAAKGKYLALCECDDYWTDDAKLDLQVKVMEASPDYALCFHPVKVFFEDNSEPDFIFPKKLDQKVFSLRNLIKTNFIQTNSVLYRRQDYSSLPLDILPLDWYLHLYHAQFGKIGFLPKIMSAYRRHKGGIWWTSGQEKVKWQKHGVQILNLFLEIDKLYGAEHGSITRKHILDAFENIIAMDKQQGDASVATIMNTSPKAIEAILRLQNDELKKLAKNINTLKMNNQNQQWTIDHKVHELNQITEELEILKQLKIVRLYERYRKLIKN